jgi:methyl-accepting chemotaxis protein
MSNTDHHPRVTEQERREVDGAELLDRLDITEEELDHRKQLAQFDDRDRERLSAMKPIFEEIEEDTVDAFYRHLQSHEITNKIFDRSTRSIDQLKEIQAQYLRELGRGAYDRSYFEKRARIGKIHEMLDLGPRVFLGGYSIYYEQILDGITSNAVERVLEEHEAKTEDQEAIEAAVTDAVSQIEHQTVSALKLLLLDQQVVFDTYIDSYSQIEEEIERQRTVATEVSRSVNQLDAGIDVVKRTAEAMDEIAEEQVGAMEEVSAEMSQLSATVEEIAGSTNEVNETSQEAETISETATDTAESAIDRIEQVEAAASDVSTDIQTLRDSVEEIDELVEVINDIAEQTNILALNASIEAARAGEEGEGFAVVADEVKSLATDSQQHAESIRDTINEVQQNTRETSESIEIANEHISQAVEEVTQTVEQLEEITDAVQEVSGSMEEIAEATDDQATSTEEVASMVHQTSSEIDDIADKVDDIVTVVNEQADRTTAIKESVSRLETET